MYKYLIFFLLLMNSTYSQDIQTVEMYESNENKTGQIVDVIATDYIRLYYTPGGNNFSYEYLTGNPNYFKGRLGKFNFPTTDLTPISELNKEQVSERPNKDFAVGTINGSASVDLSGAFTYNIPIRALPGTNGVAPQISLSYSSNSQNGIAGWGWNISGLSAISRIGKDKFHDGVIEKIQLNNLDKLVLDGNRLVVVEGSEGSSNAIYATEVGNSLRIYPKAIGNNGYQWFEVNGKDGSVAEYGNTVASKLETQKGIFSWFVNKITDENGNYIIFEYGKNREEVFIKSISYTGNEDAGLSPFAKIEFIYEKRNDNNSLYFEGIEFNQSIILKEISVQYEEEVAHKYVFEYINDIGYCQLYRIIEFGLDGERYNSTIFEYYAQENVENKSAIRLENEYIPELDSANELNIAEFFGDFNGDKITDRLLVSLDEPLNESDWYMQFGEYFGSDDAGGFVGTEYLRENRYSFKTPPGGHFQFTTRGWENKEDRLLLNQVIIADINGDGYDDVITPYLEGRKNTIGEQTPELERYHKLKIRIDTSDGSRLHFANDFTVISKRMEYTTGGLCSIVLDYIIMNENLHIGDFDGDGYLELMIHATQYDTYTTMYPFCVKIFNDQEHYHLIYYVDLSDVSSNGKGFIKKNITSSILMMSKEDDDYLDVNAQVIPLNYNGNRKTDLMFISDKSSDEGFYELNSDNTSLVKINNNKLDVLKPKYYYYPGDFNGDGLTDLLYYKKSDGAVWRIRHGLDKDFSDEYEIQNFNFGPPEPFDVDDPFNQIYKDVPFVVDLNGDGKTDILWYTTNSTFYVPYPNPAYFYYHIFLSYGKNKFKYTNEVYQEEQWQLHRKTIYSNGIVYNKRTFLIDFNGDGYMDFYNPFYVPFSHTNYILSFNFADNGLHLKNIYDGYNNKISVTYEPLSKGVDTNNEPNPYKKGQIASYPVRDIGGGGYVVSSVKKFTADDEFTQPKSIVNYKYWGALAHLEGKGFIGFKQIAQFIPELDGEGERSIHTHNNLNTDKYVLLNVGTNMYYINSYYDINELLYEASNTNTLYDLPNSRYFTYQNSSSSVNYLYNTKHERIDRTVDEWGNILTEERIQGSFGDRRMTTITTNEYDDINLNLDWCDNNKLIRTTITQNHINDNDPVYSRKIEYSYDSGNRYRLQKTTLDPNKTGKVEVTYNYNQLGNVTRKTTKQFADVSLPERFTNYVYDSYGRFLTVESNSLGQRESFSYNLLTGNLLEYEDISGTRIEYEYDGFGRLTKETIPALNNATTNYALRWAGLSDPTGTCFVTEMSGADIPDSKVFYDSWNRDIFSQQTSYFPEKTLRIKKEYKYDGRLTKVTQPYNIAEYPSNNPPKFQEYYYDSYKRLLEVRDVNQLASINLSTGYEYYSDGSSVTAPDGGISYTRYDLGGFPIESEDPAGNIVKYYYNNNGQVDKIKTVGLDTQDELTVMIEYDEYGNQHKLIDLDAGTQIYDYNAFGELVKHTTPLGYLSFQYDILGRLTQKIVFDNSTSTSTDYVYGYIQSGNGIGQIESITSTDNINKYFFYDNLGRITKTTDNIQGKAFSYEYNYKNNGFLESIKYPSGVVTKNVFNANGYLHKVLRTDVNPSGVPMFEIVKLDELENLTEYKLTNGILTTKYTYDNQDFLTKIKTYKTVNENDRIQELDFDYFRNSNQSGLLKKRTDAKNNQYEEFEYDNLYRLTQYKTTNQTNTSSTIEMTYYEDGSIKSKTGTGDYFYNSDFSNRYDIEEPVHAIKGLSTETGTRPDHRMSFTPFNSIKTIEEGDKKSHFYYGDDEQRKKMEFRTDNVLEYTKYYIDDYELIVYPDQTTKEITYLDGGCTIVKDGTNPEATYYIHSDHLGSLQSITDVNGNLVNNAEFSFDPWGNLRDNNDWLIKYSNESTHSAFDIIGRGFTGHEHMVEFGLINMNGRVYDPHISQFIQPDNFIQSPGFSQSYNRFSYCWNNPLNYTDPSGEFIMTALMIATVAYKVASISHDTWASWSTYGREAGLNTLTTSFALEATKSGWGYAIGATAGLALEWGISLTGLNPDLLSFSPEGELPTGISDGLPIGTGGAASEFTWGPKQILGLGAATITPAYVSKMTAVKRVIESGVLGSQNSIIFGIAYGSLDAGWITGTNLLHRLGLSDKPATNIEGDVKDSHPELLNSFVETTSFFIGGYGMKGISASAKVCFIAGTMIATPSGMKEIQSLRQGDTVWSYNIESSKSELALVQNIFARNSQEFVKLHFAGDTIVCTPEHPFFVNNDWVAAGELKARDSLFCYSGEKVKLDSVFSFRTDTATAVYNLEASGNHNYYVSANKVLVHNKNPLSGSSLKKSYSKLVENATERFGGNVTVQRDGIDLFRVHQPNSGHGYKVTQFKKNVSPNGKTFKNPTDVNVRKTHLKQLNRALKGDPRYSIRTRGGR